MAIPVIPVKLGTWRQEIGILVISFLVVPAAYIFGTTFVIYGLNATAVTFLSSAMVLFFTGIWLDEKIKNT